MIKNASNGAILDVILLRNTYCRREFNVVRLSGEWPLKKDLFDLCESGNFGGIIYPFDYSDRNDIHVHVYTD